MSDTTRPPVDGVGAAQLARAELYDTLGQLRSRLDYAQRIDDALDRTRERVRHVQRTRPVVFAVGVATVAAAAGAAAWGAARVVVRAFE